MASVALYQMMVRLEDAGLVGGVYHERGRQPDYQGTCYTLTPAGAAWTPRHFYLSSIATFEPRGGAWRDWFSARLARWLSRRAPSRILRASPAADVLGPAPSTSACC